MRKYLNLQSPYGAANWLNHHSITLPQLQNLHLGNHPPHVLADVACLAYARQAPLIRVLSRQSSSSRELFGRMSKALDILPKHLHENLKVAVGRMVDRHMLESTPDGVVTAIRGGFSFNVLEEEELYFAQCPACGASSEGEFDEESAIHATFDHVQGPYHRCNNCEEVRRPEVYEEMGYPSYYDDEHDQYIQDLDNCLALMAAEAIIPVPFDHVHVTSSRADWTGRSGAAVITATPDALAKLLSVRGDYTISDGKLVCRQGQFPYMSCVMSHHDVPTGSSITITPVWECEVSSGGELIPPEDTANAAKRAEAVRTLFAGLHPSLTGYKYQMCSAEGWVEAVEEFVVSLEDFFEGHHPLLTLIEGADPLNLEAIKALRELLDIVRESSINA